MQYSLYVKAHEYLPAAEFIAAVMGCAVPGTAAYAALAELFSRRSGT